jgi:hypothetical protein
MLLIPTVLPVNTVIPVPDVFEIVMTLFSIVVPGGPVILKFPVTVRDLDTFRVPIFEEAEKRVATLEKPSVFEVVENIYGIVKVSKNNEATAVFTVSPPLAMLAVTA